MALTLWLFLTSHLTFKRESSVRGVQYYCSFRLPTGEEGHHCLSRSLHFQKGKTLDPAPSTRFTGSRTAPAPGHCLPAPSRQRSRNLRASCGHYTPQTLRASRGPDVLGPRSPASSRPSFPAAYGFPEPQAMRPPLLLRNFPAVKPRRSPRRR